MSEEYNKLYGGYFTTKGPVKQKPHNKKLSVHAQCRCHERFIIPDGLTEDDVVNDIRKGWKTIRMAQNGKWSIMGKLGIYIMGKDFVIITMYKKPLKLDDKKLS